MADSKKSKPSENLNVPEDIPEELYRGHDGTQGGDADQSSWWSDPEAMSSDLSEDEQKAVVAERKKSSSSTSKSTGGSH